MSAEDGEALIRQEAYRLWEAEGWPEGRADLHWVAAKEIIAVRESYASTLRRLEDTTRDTAEPAIAFENQGEMPTLTDQGEGESGPNWIAAKDAAEILPLTTHPIGHLEELGDLSAVHRGINAAVDRINRKRSA